VTNVVDGYINVGFDLSWTWLACVKVVGSLLEAQDAKEDIQEDQLVQQ
jgi:hypothetical protein